LCAGQEFSIKVNSAVEGPSVYQYGILKIAFNIQQANLQGTIF
jgi:hypothetical protein